LSWTGQSKGNKTGYGIFIKILKTVGVAPAYLLLAFVAVYYFLFSWKSSKNLWYYTRSRLRFSVCKSVMILYKNYYCFGQTLIDRIVMMADIKNNFTFNFDDEIYFNEMIAQGKGGLLLSGHLGNWEIAGHLLKKRFTTPINIVMYDGESEQLKQYLEGVTGQRNARIIVIKEDLSHIYNIMEALENNEFVCMHADRFLPENKTLQADFLGKAATFPAGPFVLASKLDVPVSFVFAMKETHYHYHFYAGSGTIYRNQTEKNQPMDILKNFIAEMEIKVKQYPEQWYNYYDFWK
jgi:predicted LPLAT superfamily acyltransferase